MSAAARSEAQSLRSRRLRREPLRPDHVVEVAWVVASSDEGQGFAQEAAGLTPTPVIVDGDVRWQG